MRKKLLNSLILISVFSFLTLPSLTSCDPDTEIKNETHNVSVKETNGVEIEVDKKTAKEGETVTISVNVTDTTKEVSAILINGSSEGVLEVTKNKTYTFIMIDKDVTISVALKDIPVEEYGITVNVDEHVTVKTLVNGTEVNKAKANDKVTLTLDIEEHFH